MFTWQSCAPEDFTRQFSTVTIIALSAVLAGAAPALAETDTSHLLLPKTPNADVPGGPGSTGDSNAIADLAPPPTTLVITTPPPLTPVKTVKLP